MDKERVTGLLDQLSLIIAGKEEMIGKELVASLEARLKQAREDLTRKEGLALSTSLSSLVQAISNASLPGSNLRFTDQEGPVWEDLKEATEKERQDALRGRHLIS